MNENRGVVAIVIAATLSAVLTLWSYLSSIHAGLPWYWGGVDYREQGQQFDDWFIRGQQQLLGFYTSLWVVSAALGGVALAALITGRTGIFSRVGCAGFMWPVFIMPLVGWLGLLSPLLVWGAAAFPLAVLIQATRRRARFHDWLCLPFYLLHLICIHAFSRDWFSVYGD